MKSVEIKGYPDYLIYEDGRVFSVRSNKFLTQCYNRGGYLILNLCKKGTKPKSHRVHRLVAEHFLPKSKNLRDVNHIDGNKANNHISNLEWSNKSLNGLHAYRMGLKRASPSHGETHGMAKLTKEDVIKIRSLYKKETNRQIAKMYGITTTQVWRIVTRKCWNHIGD
jgi:hypothetical protein